MTREVHARVLQLITDLDSAIACAVEDPLQLAEISLDGIASNCRDLGALAEESGLERPDRSRSIDTEEGQALLWQVRSRAGRLQLLLESAAQFYNNCFSLSQPEYSAYGVHGEWSAAAHSSHVSVDC